MQKMNENVRFISSFSYMDTVSAKSLIFGSIFCFISITIVPLAVTGHFSVFLYSLIVEREERTKYMMQVHGMQLSLYYLVNYFFFFFLSFTSTLIFVFASIYITELPLFENTNFGIICLLYALFSHSQICLAFLIQNFPLNTKTAVSKLNSIWVYPFNSDHSRVYVYQYKYIYISCRGSFLSVFSSGS